MTISALSDAPHLVRSGRWILAAALLATGCKKQADTATPEPAAPPPAEQPAPEQAKAPEREYPDPPPPSDPKPVNFPEVQEFRMDNGLKVYVVENHEVPVVSARLVIKAGTMDDEHVAEFTADMLGEGTKSRSKAKIDEAIEFVGGSLWAGAGVHATTVSARALKKDLKLALTLMADEIMNPAFPADSLEKLKKQAKTSLDSAKADPGTLASTLFDMVAYPEGHPYGRPFPKPEDIDKVTVDDLKKFHATFYRSNNAYLILSGDITKEDAQPLLKRTLGKWKPVDPKDLPPNPLNKFTKYDLPQDLVVHLVDRPGSAQAEIRVGNLALARNHPDWIKLEVANAILGEGSNGRLFMDIREERGLTYGIYSHVASGQAPGTFVISTRTKTKKTADMMTAIFEHIDKIRDEKPTEEEFSTVQRKLTGKFPLEIETADQVAGKVRTILEYNLPKDYYRTYRDNVAAVTPEDVRTVARKYIHAVPHIVIVGKAKKIEKQIKKALPTAKIVKYNTDLERIDGAKKG